MTQPVQFYPDKGLVKEMDEARDKGESRSQWIQTAVRNQLERENVARTMKETRAEERVEEVAQFAVEEIEETAEEMRELIALTAMYSVADFDLASEGVPDPRVQDAFSRGKENVSTALVRLDSGSLALDPDIDLSRSKGTADTVGDANNPESGDNGRDSDADADGEQTDSYIDSLGSGDER